MDEIPTWQVIAFESSRGEKYIEEFIKSLDSSTVSKVTHIVDLLEKYGFLLGLPHSKKITTDLYELRIRGKEEIRIIYAFVKRNIYLLHAFKKKTERTPQKEINTATNRFNTLK